jgi:hypothetical protein
MSCIFAAKKLVVIPPLLRYLFAGCCMQPGQCSNVSEIGHAKLLRTDTIELRNCLERFVSDLDMSCCGVPVLDCCCVTDCNP